MGTTDVCYTRETAIEKALEMENENYEVYKNAYFTIKNDRTKKLVKELALDELKHKYSLEKAVFQEQVSLHDSDEASGQSMNLSLMLSKKPLDENSTDQEVMIYAIHEEKRVADFYKNLIEQCSGAPMEKIFKDLYEEEVSHLAQLESLYESVYMPEN